VCHASQARKFRVHKKPTWINATPKTGKKADMHLLREGTSIRSMQQEKAGPKPRQLDQRSRRAALPALFAQSSTDSSNA
jgi:hypothetical protein